MKIFVGSIRCDVRGHPQSSAEKRLLRLSRQLQLRIADRLEELRPNPRVNAIKLSGADNTWRVRIGAYRVVYVIDDDKYTVVVTIVAHRREVYR